MKVVWFQQCGWFYRPVSFVGFVIVCVATAYCVQVFVAVDRRSHSVSDTLNGVFPYVTSCFLMLNWLAIRTSVQDSGIDKV